MKPSIGRIVHYVTREGLHAPAIVTAVNKVSGMCCLTVWLPNLNPICVIVEYNEGHKPGTWHWPEREEPETGKARL